MSRNILTTWCLFMYVCVQLSYYLLLSLLVYRFIVIFCSFLPSSLPHPIISFPFLACCLLSFPFVPVLSFAFLSISAAQPSQNHIFKSETNKKEKTTNTHPCLFLGVPLKKDMNTHQKTATSFSFSLRGISRVARCGARREPTHRPAAALARLRGGCAAAQGLGRARELERATEDGANFSRQRPRVSICQGSIWICWLLVRG